MLRVLVDSFYDGPRNLELEEREQGGVVMKQMRTQGTERKHDNLELPPSSSSSFRSKLSGKII